MFHTHTHTHQQTPYFIDFKTTTHKQDTMIQTQFQTQTQIQDDAQSQQGFQGQQEVFESPLILKSQIKPSEELQSIIHACNQMLRQSQTPGISPEQQSLYSHNSISQPSLTMVADSTSLHTPKPQHPISFQCISNNSMENKDYNDSMLTNPNKSKNTTNLKEYQQQPTQSIKAHIFTHRTPHNTQHYKTSQSHPQKLL